MQKFQTVSYVFGFVVAVGIASGLGVKVGEPVSKGARAEMCTIGKVSNECSSTGETVGPSECDQVYEEPLESYHPNYASADPIPIDWSALPNGASQAQMLLIQAVQSQCKGVEWPSWVS